MENNNFKFLENKYKLKEIISQENEINSFIAQDLESNETILIKAISKSKSDSLKDIEVFEKQINAIKDINLENLPKFVNSEFLEDENEVHSYAVFKYIKGNLVTNFNKDEVLPMLSKYLDSLAKIKADFFEKLYLEPKNIISNNQSKLNFLDFKLPMEIENKIDNYSKLVSNSIKNLIEKYKLENNNLEISNEIEEVLSKVENDNSIDLIEELKAKVSKSSLQKSIRLFKLEKFTNNISLIDNKDIIFNSYETIDQGNILKLLKYRQEDNKITLERNESKNQIQMALGISMTTGFLGFFPAVVISWSLFEFNLILFYLSTILGTILSFLVLYFPINWLLKRVFKSFKITFDFEKNQFSYKLGKNEIIREMSTIKRIFHVKETTLYGEQYGLVFETKDNEKIHLPLIKKNKANNSSSISIYENKLKQEIEDLSNLIIKTEEI